MEVLNEFFLEWDLADFGETCEVKVLLYKVNFGTLFL